MSDGLMTKQAAAPSLPAANKVKYFVDADRRLKTLDENGVISVLSEIGLQDRNVLTNGGMMVQQRVATASTAIPGITTTTRAGQVADRWAVTTSVASNLNWAQIDSIAAAETGLLARYYGSIISASAGKKVMLSQFLIASDIAHLRGQRVRVSVKTNQKVGSPQTFKLGLLQLNASGTVDVCPAFLSGAWSTTTGVDPAWGTNLAAIAPDASPTGENGTISGSYLNITTTQNAWQRSSACFTVPANAKNLVVVLFADATGGTTDNLSASEFQLTQGLEIIDFVQPPLAEELVRCLRFFCKSFPLTVVPAASVTEASGGSGVTGRVGIAGAVALACYVGIQFPVPMWRVPTIVYFTPTAAGAQMFRLDGTGPVAQTATASRTNSVTTNGAVCSATGDAAGVVGNLVAVHYTADAEFVT